ncbi:MAG: radical SAM protein [Candidatus Bathyarchaeum sp.]|nr:MAG: radical SAM protein [Candidatus Bathyarchaeum sp.]
MNLLANQKLWNAVLKTPPVKWMLRTTLKTCPECNRTPLETALDNYAGTNHSSCSSCNLYAKIINFWIGFIQTALAVEKSRVSKLFADSYTKRAIKSIVLGFADFGFNRPLQIHAPLLVVWNFTHKCNLSCKHCYSDAGNLSKMELSTKEAMNVVDQIADFGVTSLAFSGGEPLMRKDFFEVAAHAVDSGLYVSLATNGTLLNPETVRKLKEIGINYVEVSLDGSDSKTHDLFRGKTGAFSQALQGLRNCVNEDLCTCLAVTATKNNLTEIPSVLALAEDMGIKRFTLFNFVPTGRGRDIIALDPSPQEREDVLNFLRRKLVEGPKLAILTTAPQLARVALQSQPPTQDDMMIPFAHMEAAKISKRAKALADFIGGCGAGRFYCAISPEGNVQPCVFLPIVVGNLKTERLKDIWLNSPVFKALRDRGNLKGRCGRCEFKFVCGGCRARAYSYHNDYLMSDPGCIRKLSEGD